MEDYIAHRMKTYRFYKEIGDRWYVDIPEWEGEKASLEMVCGADLMLTIISQGESEITLSLSSDSEISGDSLILQRESPEMGEGAWYKLTSWKGIDFDLDVWLCDVTVWVFGEFPKRIWIC